MYTILNGADAARKLDLAYQIAGREGIPNMLLGMPSDAYANMHPELLANGSMWKEAASRIVLGDKPLDYVDQFFQDWRAPGGDQIVKDEAEWFHEHHSS